MYLHVKNFATEPTRIPEVMFCTEEEAVKAGFRPPKQ
ncbi:MULTISPECIES: sunset domain-containing protein [Bacillus cereus group]